MSVATEGTLADRVVAQVSAAELPGPTRLLLTSGAGRAEGVVCVAPGSQRVFAARAYDREGRVTHAGRAVLDVTSAMPHVDIEMAARLGGPPLALRIRPRERAGALTRAAEPLP